MRRDILYLRDIVDAADAISAFTAGKTRATSWPVICCRAPCFRSWP